MLLIATTRCATLLLIATTRCATLLETVINCRACSPELKTKSTITSGEKR